MDIRKQIIRSLFLILIGLLSACVNQTKQIDNIELIDDIDNYQASIISVDYNQAINTGFIIPSTSQTESGFFEFNFKIVNNSAEATKYYYKIYYQNESYKLNEVNEDGTFNPLCEENFYGSYEDVNIGFKATKKLELNEMITISDSIKIVGNPRNEEKFFGNPIRYFRTIPEEELEIKMEQIRNSPDWFKSIIKKAEDKGVSVEDQLLADAEYIINYDLRQGKDNNRWKRNPRMGNYNFLFVIVPEKSLHQIPDYIKNISLQSENHFVNPYYYFKYGEGNNLENIVLKKLANDLTVKAKLPIANGVWVASKNNMGQSFDTSYFAPKVNNSKKIYTEAPFRVYGNYRPHDDSIYNVPVTADFFGKGYTKEEYEKNAAIPKEERKPIIFTNTKTPGKNIKVDTTNNLIRISNPGCTLDDPKKENVGIISQHGLTYGKFTVKVKLTQQLTEDNVWNGITDAIWLITESLEPYNARRVCNKEGFMPYYGAGEGIDRVPQISYTEIDFEIVKAAETWPHFSYSDGKERPEPASNVDKVMVTCTNWDMACKQPKNFGTGVQEIDYLNHTFYSHRWDEWYNATTQKTPVSDDELFKSDYYYFQIDWKPTEIIWRIGPEKDKLRVVGYINDEYTSIPNNQMLLIFTQEFHYSAWWPKSPFKQEDVPFPAEDMEGVIYEVTVE